MLPNWHLCKRKRIAADAGQLQSSIFLRARTRRAKAQTTANYIAGDGDGEGEALFFEVELFLVEVVDFFAVLEVLAAGAPFLAVVELVVEVVLMVSLLFAQEARKATPIKATTEERMIFFISW
ncbi:MAG: hypothetical protein ACXWBS_00795 [Chthoniobacterales bacterium]